MTDPLLDRARGCLLGLAVGDAVGTTLEFRRRGSFTPINDMVGGGPFGLKPGQWTDDTSMALCLATSLVEHGFDPLDQMKRYVKWRDTGFLSSTGTCFDIGNTVASALHRFERTGEPFSGSVDPHSAGNGSIMRLAPVVLFAWPDRERAAALAAESSRTTHGANEAVDACVLLSAILHAALNGEPGESVLQAPDTFFRAADESADQRMSLSPGLLSIVRGDYQNKGADAIRGSGYVTESLEAALWCFARTDCFRDAILAAANLGDDADTTAAVCGQVAGAFYGESAIPADWLQRLHLHGFIRDLAHLLIAVQPTDIHDA